MRLKEDQQILKHRDSGLNSHVELTLNESMQRQLKTQGFIATACKACSIYDYLRIPSTDYRGAELLAYIKSYYDSGQENYKRGLLFMHPSLIIPMEAFRRYFEILNRRKWKPEQIAFLNLKGEYTYGKESPKPAAKKAKQTKQTKESTSTLMDRLAL